MKGRKSKLALGLAIVGATGALAAPVFAARAGDADDSVSPASTPVTATLAPGTNATFDATVSGQPVTVTCTTSSLSAVTPATGFLFTKVTRPTFSGCTDSLGGTDTVVTSGKWTLKFRDAAADESKGEPGVVARSTVTTSGDGLGLSVPPGGITLTPSTFPTCNVIVSPGVRTPVHAAYDDINTATINGASLPAAADSGCPGGAQAVTAIFNATYVNNPGFSDVS